MPDALHDLDAEVREAVRFFWRRRSRQAARQKERGTRDQGSRGAVTGGSQMDGFSDLISRALARLGVPPNSIYRKTNVEIPGFYRPTKEWDLLVVNDGALVAAIEVKSQVGPSFGNNFNNRTEEAMGSATCLWTAYREGAFAGSPRPWLGYLMVLEQADRSMSPVQVREPHFPAFPEFKGASYAKRYEIFCRKLIRERLYDAACLLLSDKKRGGTGEYTEPDPEVGVRRFFSSLAGHVRAFLESHQR